MGTPNYPAPEHVGLAMGQDILYLLYYGYGYHLYQPPNHPGATPAKVIIDELATADHGGQSTWQNIAKAIEWCGGYINGQALSLVGGKWAVAVQHAQNNRGYTEPGINAALAWIFAGNGTAVFEMYANRSWYCAYAKDPWLVGFFKHSPDGNPTIAGFDWVWNQGYVAQRDKIKVMFGVHDGMVGTDNPNGPLRFMDRMFYVWKHYCFPGAIAYSGGGAGSWQWDENVGVANPPFDGRDQAFVNIWNNYIRDGLPGPNYTVTCI